MDSLNRTKQNELYVLAWSLWALLEHQEQVKEDRMWV